MPISAITPVEGQPLGVVSSVKANARGSLTPNIRKRLRLRNMSWPAGVDPVGDLPVTTFESLGRQPGEILVEGK